MLCFKRCVACCQNLHVISYAHRVRKLQSGDESEGENAESDSDDDSDEDSDEDSDASSDSAGTLNTCLTRSY